jgi:serine protease Do
MNTLPDNSNLPDAIERLAASVASLATRRHRSSGVLWREGVLVGSASALWRASSVALLLPSGERIIGNVRGVDASTDLAAVTFTSGAMPVADRSELPAPRMGDFVFAVGRATSGQAQASFGHVGSAGGPWRTWRGGRVDRLIRLDGGLYPGLEGAPVANTAGQLLGIASSALSRQHGIVLPALTVDRVLDELLAHGHVQRGYLGIAAQPVRASLNGAEVDALLVSSLASDGPAARAGLLVGDAIVKIDGDAVGSLDALREKLQVGASLRVELTRGGAGRELVLEVAQRPPSRCG